MPCPVSGCPVESTLEANNSTVDNLHLNRSRNKTDIAFFFFPSRLSIRRVHQHGAILISSELWAPQTIMRTCFHYLANLGRGKRKRKRERGNWRWGRKLEIKKNHIETANKHVHNYVQLQKSKSTPVHNKIYIRIRCKVPAFLLHFQQWLIPKLVFN